MTGVENPNGAARRLLTPVLINMRHDFRLFRLFTFVSCLGGVAVSGCSAGAASNDSHDRQSTESADLRVEEGNRVFEIERVDVVGNQRVARAELIRLLGVAPGQRVSRTALEQGLARVRAANGVKRADLSTEAQPGKPDKWTLTLEVQESSP